MKGMKASSDSGHARCHKFYYRILSVRFPNLVQVFLFYTGTFSLSRKSCQRKLFHVKKGLMIYTRINVFVSQCKRGFRSPWQTYAKSFFQMISRMNSRFLPRCLSQARFVFHGSGRSRAHFLSLAFYGDRFHRPAFLRRSGQLPFQPIIRHCTQQYFHSYSSIAI